MDGVDGDVAAFGNRHHFGVGDVAVKLDAVAGILFEPVQIGAAAHDVQLYIFAVVQQFPNAFAHGFHVIAVTERAQVEEARFAVAEVFCRYGIGNSNWWRGFVRTGICCGYASWRFQRKPNGRASWQPSRNEPISRRSWRV